MPSNETEEPRYWLTGKLFCGECVTTMHGVSGTSKTGKIHYYYACKNHRKHACNMNNVPKDKIEIHVVWVLRELLEDAENVAGLVADIASYHKNLYADNGYIESLESHLKETERNILTLSRLLKKVFCLIP